MSRRTITLQLGFGLGHAFLEAWHDWRSGAALGAPPARLDFIAIASPLPEADALRRAHHGSALQPLADALAAQWPRSGRNLHRLGFDAGRVQLLLAPGDALQWLPQLRAQVDRILIDEGPPAADPRQASKWLAKGLARLAVPGARLSAKAASPTLASALVSAGFELLEDATGLGAVCRPRFTLRGRGRDRAAPSEHPVLIVGAGLAGCALAAALAEQGWRSTLIDAAAAAATQGSGNPAGLFHGVVNPQDGVHARFNRAAALQAQHTVQQALHTGLVQGSVQGLLRLETSGKCAAQMRSELQALQLPADYVQALDAAQASAHGGLPLAHPAWLYPGGGWVQPAALARASLHRASAAVEFRGGLHVASLRRSDGRWQLLDAAGGVIITAETVVLANAFDALRLLQATHWPVRPVRGQISLCADSLLRLPRLPLAGEGYLLPSVDGNAIFGASSQADDADAQPRDADHLFNLERLARLSAQPLPAPWQLQGRVGWRCVAHDRLPLVGAVPDEVTLADAAHERLAALPRRPGLYLFSGLGSRGIVWSELSAQLLAAQICGAPLPLEAALVDALDPARFVLRQRRALRSAG